MWRCGSGQKPVVGICRHGNYLLDNMKASHFFHQVSYYVSQDRMCTMMQVFRRFKVTHKFIASVGEF
jgi:hypothetical protein